MTAVAAKAEITISAAVRRLGGVPQHRIRLVPYPATEDDVAAIRNREYRRYELIEGILLEKAMGYPEGFIATELARLLGNFVRHYKLGVVNGPDGMMRLASGLVRIPDVSFCTWDQFPGRRVPDEAIPLLCPALAVEVLSPSNTRGEMDDKLAQYFASGTRLVWLVDRSTRTVDVFTSPDRAAARRLGLDDTLTGDPVLPGFTLVLAELFAELDPQ